MPSSRISVAVLAPDARPSPWLKVDVGMKAWRECPSRDRRARSPSASRIPKSPSPSILASQARPAYARRGRHFRVASVPKSPDVTWAYGRRRSRDADARSIHARTRRGGGREKPGPGRQASAGREGGSADRPRAAPGERASPAWYRGRERAPFARCERGPPPFSFTPTAAPRSPRPPPRHRPPSPRRR